MSRCGHNVGLAIEGRQIPQQFPITSNTTPENSRGPSVTRVSANHRQPLNSSEKERKM